MQISYMNVELGTEKESVPHCGNQDTWVVVLGPSTN